MFFARNSKRPARPLSTRRLWRLGFIELEDRITPTAPAAPVIIEPFAEGQITGTFDINMQTDPTQYFDPDGNAWQATDWQIRDVAANQIVWQLPFSSAPPLTLYRVDFSDGAFVNLLAGRTELDYNKDYQLIVKYRDSNNEVSAAAVRNFHTTAATTPVPGGGQWLVRPGYTVELVQTGLRLPVNIAFVPNPGPNPTDPLYYVSELYGSIRVVRRDGTMQTFATGLLDYNPEGPISGVGEQGLTGLAVERDAVNPNIYHLYVGMLWDNGSPAGPPNHYPKVERIDSAVGGLTMASRTLLLNMQPVTQGQSHIISNITIGPDNKLYVHMGDGFNAATALNLNDYRGKILRMNKDGTPVATGDPAGANPFYDPSDGINAKDYIFTYGHRNPFGGAWRPGTNQHWIVENGNSLDRMVDLVSGQSYGWAGNDSTHIQYSKFIWNPSTAPVNISFVDSTILGGSGFPAEAMGHAFVSLSGSTYSAGPLQRAKAIAEFSDLDTLGADGKLLVQPTFLVKYNGTGRASVAGLAAGPDGLYFSDLYEDSGSSGATSPGANIYRVRYVGNAGGQTPTVATAASANPNPVTTGITTALSVLGADDGGEPALTYTWGVFGNPAGSVNFSANASNAAKNTVATFSANGTYDLFVVIRDIGGQSAISTVTVTVNSIPTGTGTGLRGTYYDQLNFAGSPLVTRIDPTVNFNWGTGSPDASIGADTFSVRWSGFVQPRYTGTYTFYTTTDDGVRLYVNNQLIIDHWVNQSGVTWSGTIALTAGQFYEIRMEYYENAGDASARLEWESATQPREVIPASQLYTATAAPTAPSSFSGQPVTSTRAILNWSGSPPPNQADDYYIEQSANGSTGWTQIGVSTTTGFEVTNLAAGTTYYFRLRAHNAFGYSDYTATTSVTTLNSTTLSINFPSFTTANTAGVLTLNGGATINTSNSRLRLTSGAANQSRSAFFNTQQTITAFSTTFTYTKSGTADGVTFVIHRDPRGVTALGEGGGLLGYDATANPALAITPSFALAINIYNGHPLGTEFITNANIDYNYSQTNINTATNNSPITVTMTYAAGFLTAVFTQGAQTETKTISIDLPALLGGTTAYVGFTGATGGASSTQDITSWTFSQGVLPGTPQNLQGSLTGYTAASTAPTPRGAHLTWTGASGASGYKIERKLGSGGTYAQVGTSSTLSFDDTGLAVGSTYYYRIRGNNVTGDGAYSTEISLTTPALPLPPSNPMTTTVTANSIGLRFTDNAGNESGFQIYRAINGGAFSLLTALPANAPTAPSLVDYTDSGLTPNTRYDYQILAFNISGASAFVGATTMTSTSAPTGLSANAASGSIGLTWTAPAGAATYNVYRGTTANGQGTTPVATGLTTTSYTDTNLAFGTTYYYKVTAVNAGGESAQSNEASALAFGPTSTSLQVSPNPSATGANLTFTATVSSSGGTPAVGTVEFYDGGTLLNPAPVPVNAFGQAFFATNSLSAGSHSITAIYSGGVGFTTSSAPAVIAVVLAPPTVTNVAVNDDAIQRSMLRSITVTFSSIVTLPSGNAAAAFQLSGPGAAGVTLNVDTSASTATRTVARITFAGGTVVNGSLQDGRYTLTVLANQVHDAAGSTLAGGNYVFGDDQATEKFFRYFGDADGDGGLGGVDFGFFRGAFGTSVGQSGYLDYLDFDGSGIGGSDWGQFRMRYGTTLP